MGGAVLDMQLSPRRGCGCRWDDINQTAGHEANRGYISGFVKAIVVDGRREFATEREVAKMEKAGEKKTTVVDASEKLCAGLQDGENVATDTSSEGEYESAVSAADATEVRRMGTQFVCQAARWAHKWLVKDDEWWCEGDAMKEAVEAGDEVFVKWHLENCKTNDSRWLMPLAASRGHVGILNLLLERGLSFNSDVVNKSIEAAADHDRAVVLQWFHDNIKVRWSSKPMDLAATRGYLDTVKWLHNNRKEGCTTGAMDGAIENVHMDVVQWLHENRAEGCTSGVIYDAAESGRFEVVKWLYRNRPNDCYEVMAITGAAQNGHLEIVKWLHENGTASCTTNAMDGAAKNGHLDVIKWLHKHRVEGCTTYAMDLAAERGDLEIVKWLHENRSEGCTANAMDRAVDKGHWDVVQWLHTNRKEGCTTLAMDAAANNGHLEIVEWLHTNRKEGCTSRAIKLAARNGHMDVVKWLRTHREECRTVATKTVKREQIREGRPTTQTMIEEPVSAQEGESKTESISEAARDGHWYVVERLLQSQSKECDQWILREAIEHRQLHIVQALYDRSEFKNWPQLNDVSVLTDLVRSKGFLPRKILQHITSRRRERYTSDAEDNPPSSDISELTITSRTSAGIEASSFTLTAVSKVCTHLKLPDVAETLICEFIMSDPRSRLSRADAIDRELVHWLLRFSEQPNEDFGVLARRGNLEGARMMHDHLKQRGQLFCSDHFKYSTMERGSLEFVQWHIRSCSDHSTESWVYLAVWIGCVDVIDWMCDHRAEVAHTMRTFPYSLDASFATVESRYNLDRKAVEAWMDELEQGNQDESLLTESEREDLLVNVMDFAATSGMFGEIFRACRKKDKPILGCSVGGFYGAIVQGHFKLVEALCILQPHLARWPKEEDGALVLRRILSLEEPNCREMLKFFRQKRNMHLEPRDLYEAIFRGDLKRVQLMCELDLVDWSLITTDAMDVAAVRGDYEMLKTLHSCLPDLRCSNRAMNGAAEEGHLEVVKYLHRHGAPYKGMALDLAAKNGRLEVVQYLWEHHSDDCSLYTMYWASARDSADNVRTIRYLASVYALCDIDKCLVMARARRNEKICAILEDYGGTDRMRKVQLSSRLLARRRQSLIKVDDRFVHLDRTVYPELLQECLPSGTPSRLTVGDPVAPAARVKPSRPRKENDNLMKIMRSFNEDDPKLRNVAVESYIDQELPELPLALDRLLRVFGVFDLNDRPGYGGYIPEYFPVDYRGRHRSQPSLPGFTSDDLTVLTGP